MTSKNLNKIFGSLFLIDYIYGLFLLSLILFPLVNITNLYEGTTLILYIGKICLHLIIGIAAIGALFINNNKFIKFSVPLYVLSLFVSKFYMIEPNSKIFKNMKQAAEQAITSGNATVSHVKATVYPFDFIYAFYVLAVVYVLFVLPWIQNNEAKKAQHLEGLPSSRGKSIL